MRKVILGLAMIVGVIALMNLSQVSSLLADESADCKACKDQAKDQAPAGCGRWKGEGSGSVEHCIKYYIAKKCEDVCKKKSGEDD